MLLNSKNICLFMNYQKTVLTSSHKVKCEGPKEGVGHPLVYFEITQEFVVCPYCSTLFKLENHENNTKN